MPYEATKCLVRRNMRDIFSHFPMVVKYLFVHCNIGANAYKTIIYAHFFGRAFHYLAGDAPRWCQACFLQAKETADTR
jgi:hypothetical protein